MAITLPTTPCPVCGLLVPIIQEDTNQPKEKTGPDGKKYLTGVLHRIRAVSWHMVDKTETKCPGSGKIIDSVPIEQ